VNSKEELDNESMFSTFSPPFLSLTYDFRFLAWELIKPKVISLLERCHGQRLKKEEMARKQTRQKSLRPRYDSLKAGLPATARPYLPLFVDFLLFPSVVPLWEEEGDVTDEVWEDALDEVSGDVEEFRIDLCTYARQVVLEATTDPDEEEYAEEDEGDLGDGFFSKATSYVACGFTHCSKSHKTGTFTRTFWRRRANKVSDSNSFGPLVEVLEHQHKLHNFDNTLPVKATKNPSSCSPSVHVHLPLEIACAVSAVLDLANLSDNATKVDLERADSRGWWEWENATSRRKSPRWHEGCIELVRPPALFSFSMLRIDLFSPSTTSSA
jgi:hypothetical protein